MKLLLRALFVMALLTLATGESFAQGQGRGFGLGARTVNAYSLVATNKALQEELKATEEQIKKLEDAMKPIGEKRRELFGQGGQRNQAPSEAELKEMEEKRAKLDEETKKAVEGVLDAKQSKRLSEINYQAMGFAAFGNKSAQEKLKMTDEQKAKYKKANEELAATQAELRKDMPRFQQGQQFSDEDRKKMQDVMTKTREAGEKAAKTFGESLAADQQKAWKDMIGEKFDVSKLSAMPRRRDN